LGKSFKVKKPRISPQQKVAEQFLAMKKAYEEKLQQQQQELQNQSSDHDLTSPREKK
jgi:hypothetical protein